MPTDLHIRELEDDLVDRLKSRAARNGRSLEEEHREILRQALTFEPATDFNSLAAELRALTARRHHTPSEVLLREGRNEQ